MSLPSGVGAALRALPEAPAFDVWLDREDSRRTQLEREVLSELRLARSDVEIRMPLDARDTTHVTSGTDDHYGAIDVRVGSAHRETRAASPEEILSLVFEAAARPQPDWSRPEYPGLPTIILEGCALHRRLARRLALVPAHVRDRWPRALSFEAAPIASRSRSRRRAPAESAFEPDPDARPRANAR